MEMIFSKSVCGLFLTVLALVASRGQAKSIAGLSDSCPLTPISMTSLYPATTTLALHPMQDTPFEDGSNPPQGTCPGLVDASEPLNKRSTCPYEHITNFDAQRIPARITEARCLCDGCIDPYSGAQSPDRTCQPIRYNMQVMRKSTTSPINGFEMYSMVTEEIVVGCACSRTD